MFVTRSFQLYFLLSLRPPKQYCNIGIENTYISFKFYSKNMCFLFYNQQSAADVSRYDLVQQRQECFWRHTINRGCSSFTLPVQISILLTTASQYQTHFSLINGKRDIDLINLTCHCLLLYTQSFQSYERTQSQQHSHISRLLWPSHYSVTATTVCHYECHHRHPFYCQTCQPWLLLHPIVSTYLI